MSGTNYQDVLASVRAFVAEEGSFDIWRPRWALSEKLAGAYDRHGRLTDTFNSQVLRAVNALVTDGTLIKTGERDRARYWTPEARAKAVAEETRKNAELDAKRKRWQGVKTGLADRGFPDTSRDEAGVRLALESWEILLGRLDLAPSGVACVTCEDTGKIVQLSQDSPAEPWRPGSYAEGVVRACPACSAGLEVMP